MADTPPKVRLNLVRPSATNQALLNRARFEYRRGIHTMAHRRGIGIPNNLKGKTFQPLNTGREAFGFPPTRPGPIPEGTYPMAMPFVPAGPLRGPPAGPQYRIPPMGPPAGPQYRIPPMGPPAGPQRRMSPIPKASEENSNNNEAFNVPLGPRPILVLKGHLAVLNENRERLEADIYALEESMRENKRGPKRRRMLIGTNRVTGQTRAELQETLNELQEELEIINQEIEKVQMKIGEQEYIEREHARAVATTRKGGRRLRRRRLARRHRTARRKPSA